MARKNFFAKMRKPRLKLTAQTFERLLSAGAPAELVDRLRSLENREFVGEGVFLENLRIATGEEQVQKHKTLILKHAQRSPKFKVRYRNRCRRCGRSRAYYRKFMLCRLCFRELALAGHIPGVTKASW